MVEKEKEYKFLGRIARCVYNSDDFKVYAVDVNKNKYPDIKLNKFGNVSISGELSDLTIGVEYEVGGILTSSKNGYGYKVLNIRRDVPKTAEAVYLFLSEILTKNQADVLFKNYPDIIERVKENRLDDIDLNKLKGIKQYTFNVIKKKIIENFCLADLVAEFQGYLNLSVIRKIYNKYTSIDVLKKKLKQNPYKCLCGLAGVGFKTADSILLDIEKVSNENINNNKTPIIEFNYDLRTSVERCLACILYILEDNENNEGHTKMNLSELRKQVLQIVPECIDHFPEAMKSESIYYSKEDMTAALKKTFDTESIIAQTVLHAINDKQIVWEYDVEKYRNVDCVFLSDEQMKAVSNVCKYTVSILNGAAGVGKSFGTQAIINMLKDNRKSFKLFSPTGKAAKVIASYTNEYASTIHRGLGYSPALGWTFNENNKLCCDIIIVDEFSMVDIWLFKHLIDAIDFKSTKLLMIGDNAQLCSVGCGNLLHDFMESNLIPTVTLTKVFRYGEGGLMKIATDVRYCKPYLSNTMKKHATTFGDNKDYTFVDLPSEIIPQHAVALYEKLLDKGYTIEDIQVLTAKNVGDCGAIVLNNALQKVANPNYGSKFCMKYGEVTYYEGDLVIQKVNNYKAERDINNLDEYEREYYLQSDEIPTAFIANGETGIVKSIYNTYMLIDFDGVVVKYTKSDLASIGLGYSISIHKSQGSSIKAVILLTPQSHIFMLNSNLIYVGLTRMKEVCYHLGTLSSVNQAVTKKANLARCTFMQDLLSERIKNNDDLPPWNL